MNTERHGAMSIQDEDLSAPGACQGATPKSAAGGDQFSDGRWRPTHRHVKRGTLYRLVSSAVLQTDEPVADNEFLALYQGEDGLYWVRPADEFKDGRFEALPPPPRDPQTACESSRAEHLLSENTSLRGRVEGLETALRRLGSMEAFTLGRLIKTGADDELLARIDFARSVLVEAGDAPV